MILIVKGLSDLGQSLFVWFQLFYYNKGFLFYIVFIIISIAIRLILSEMKDWKHV